MARLALTLLGGFEARLPQGGASLAFPKKTQALIAYLALAPKPISRTELATLLWGDTGRAQAQQSLRQTLSVLRQGLGRSGAVLVAETQVVSLDRSELQVDVTAFEALLDKDDARSVAEATALYHGDLLAGLDLDEAPFEEWLLAQRERLRELALNALTRLLARQSEAGALDEAVLSASRLIALDPLHEPAHRALMKLYVGQGRRPAALRQYQTCVAALRRELGAEPATETQRVYAEVLRGSAAPAAPAKAPDARQREQDRERLFASGAAAPIVGREPELERLREAMTQSFEDRGALVAIWGEAGVGKSRLLRQVAAEASERGAAVLLGRAYRTEQILPFGPWRDALREAEVLDDPEALFQAADPARVFAATVELIDAQVAARPLALLFEDLQWADDMSLRLLAYVARRIADKPVLLIGTVRSEELIDAPALRGLLEDLDRERGVLKLALEPLSRDATSELVRALGRPADEADTQRLSERIWQASEGNALMAVEILRAVQDGDASPGAAAAPMPERVRQVVSGRLERLGETAHALLGAASVIGRDFDFNLLRGTAQMDEAAAAGALEELVRRRVLRVAGERFEFTHDRIREIVHGELLAPRRRLLHRQAAQAIRSLHATALAPHYATLEPHLAALGAHAAEAEQWAEAADCYRRAGEWAMARSFNREAAAAFERAVAAIDRAPEAAAKAQAVDLRLMLRNALTMSGEAHRARMPLDEAQRLAEALADRVRLGRVAAHRSAQMWWTGRPREALAAAEAVARLAEETQDPALRVAAITGRGYAYHGMGNYRVVQETLEPLFAAPEGRPYGTELLPIVSPLNQAIAGLAHCGEFERALERAHGAVARAEALDHRYLLMHACWTLGEVHVHRTSMAGMPHLQRALGLILDRGDFFVPANVIGSIGYLQVLSGDTEAGLARMRESLGSGQPNWRVGLARMLARLGEAYLVAGRIEEARATAGQCLALTRAHGERGYEAWALRLLGEIDGAQANFTTALATSEELGMKPMAAHCHAGLARLYRRQGDATAAAKHRDTAAGMYREMEIGFWPALLDADAISAT